MNIVHHINYYTLLICFPISACVSTLGRGSSSGPCYSCLSTAGGGNGQQQRRKRDTDTDLPDPSQQPIHAHPGQSLTLEIPVAKARANFKVVKFVTVYSPEIGTMEYKLTSGNDAGHFYIQSKPGSVAVLRIKKKINIAAKYELKVDGIMRTDNTELAAELPSLFEEPSRFEIQVVVN